MIKTERAGNEVLGYSSANDIGENVAIGPVIKILNSALGTIAKVSQLRNSTPASVYVADFLIHSPAQVSASRHTATDDNGLGDAGTARKCSKHRLGENESGHLASEPVRFPLPRG